MTMVKTRRAAMGWKSCLSVPVSVWGLETIDFLQVGNHSVTSDVRQYDDIELSSFDTFDSFLVLDEGLHFNLLLFF